MMTNIADLLLAAGLFLFALTAAMTFMTLFGGGPLPNAPGMLTNKNVRKALIDDYRSKKVVAGGPLGLLKIMAITALLLLAGGGLLKFLLMLF